MKKLLAVALFVAFAACSNSKYKFWDISKFNMKPDALEESEEIKVIYTSQGPGYNENLEYYIHLIVVSQKTGDTVNLLTTAFDVLRKKDADNVFNYSGPESVGTKISQILRLDSGKMREIKHVDEITNFKIKEITKVARDPKFDYIADNKYPTVIGSICKVTNTATDGTAN